jgi:subtilisin family serine protease
MSDLSMTPSRATLALLLLTAVLVLVAGCAGPSSVPPGPAHPHTLSPAATQKLSTELRQLLDPRLIPASISPDQFRDLLRRKNILVPAQDVAVKLNISPANRVYNDHVPVYIYLTRGTPVQAVDPYITLVINRKEEYHVVVAWVDVTRLEELAALDGVRVIRPIEPPEFSIGKATTEGAAIHGTADLQNLSPAFNGTGVKIGVISNGVNNWQIARDTGDLPSTIHILNTSTGDEGTAMLEVLHDIAPGADLYFHDCGSDVYTFMDAVDELVTDGCTVIVDDINWKYEPFYENGDLGAHLGKILQTNRVVYVSSAGNTAYKHYEGDYLDNGNHEQDFSGGAHQPFNFSLDRFADATIVLQWNDPFAASDNNYDLYLYDSTTGKLLAYSNNSQTGMQDPIEILGYENPGKDRIDAEIRVVNVNGTARPRNLAVFIHDNGGVFRSAYSVKNGSVVGHQSLPGVVTVGAVGMDHPGVAEFYSSRGPVMISYPARETRQKPDICGVTDVRISGAGGFPAVNPGRFPGTSAAAPHIAGVVASVWGAYPNLTADEVREYLYRSADPVEDVNGCGHGLANATAMVRKIQAEKKAGN